MPGVPASRRPGVNALLLTNAICLPSGDQAANTCADALPARCPLRPAVRC